MADTGGRRDFRFLRRPRWIFGTLAILLVAAGLMNLGFWQLRRTHQRLRRNSTVEARMNAPAQPLAEALARYRLTAPMAAADAAAYRHVVVSGRYDAAGEVLLRSRSEGGHPGFDVITPLELADGKALLVDRGWVPYTDSDPPIPAAAPPAGRVTLTGLLRRPNPEPSGLFKSISPQDPATGPLKKTFYVNPHRLQGQFRFPLIDGYLQLATQSPAQQSDLPVMPHPPQLSNGPFLSYTIQWFSFTAIGLVGYAVVLERRSRNWDEDGDGADGAGGPGGAGGTGRGEGDDRDPPPRGAATGD